MNHSYVAIFLTLAAVFSLSACNYSVSVNDKVVYTPAPLFSDYQIADTHLHRCVEQTIDDKKITNPKQLLLLNCSNAGIKTLAGLEVFDGLEELNLASNKLQSIDPLGKLTQLKVLILRENTLTDISPLLSLLRLAQVDLERNSDLACADVRQLALNLKETDAEVLMPEQCH